MAGTVTLTEITHVPLRKVTFDWESSAGGAADATTTETYTGRIVYVAQIPDTGGTQPTDAYDVTVTDADGIDLLNGLGVNLSNAANTYKSDKDGLGAVVESKLTLAVTNAGNAKGGKTVVFMQ